YDIRGLYPDEIDGELAEQIGRAFAHVLAKLSGKPVAELRVGLGRDMRLSAPELSARYREGLLGEGVNVIDAGQVGSEMLYFLVGSRELDGGLMCTASHNPKAYTGAKLVREGAIALSGDSGIQDIRHAVEAQSADGARADAAATRGTLEAIDLYAEFQAAALRFIDADAVRAAPRRLKVVLDGGNGMAGPMVGPVLDSLNLELIETYWTPDGNFPDHEPNPLLPENRRVIMEKVRSSGADLGIAWDGDADRCFFIDDNGAFVDGDFLTALLAGSLLEKVSNPTHREAILYDVRASRAVPDTVTRAGGTPYVNRVGHAFFKTRMRKEGSLFGGEVSGHYYFRDFYCADSGTIPALLVLEMLCTQGKRLSELLAPYHARYFISGEVNSEVADPAAKMEEIAARYADAGQDRLDGISIDYEDWHFNVRSSNTEPLLRLCLESLVSREDMERRRDEVLALIRA
ncbi:MAG TPA: phosphomannomutase/phosphoglucomutase, partial [Solirubrobacteraceae bacterium]|nr:phosphomannomutase/phosphoglucomutase [Solirubrobacteraceae bacterium]